ncbi:ABC transporter ATP-binding protein [Mycobacterium sp. NPDC003449]
MTSGTAIRPPAAGQRDPVVETRGLSKTYETRRGGTQALSAVDFTLARGEFVALLGPSGCGKSTLLNMVAGLIAPSAGTLLFEGRALDGPNTAIGYMTQRDSILPWRTVRENIDLPLAIRGVPKAQRATRVAHYIDLVRLGGFEDAYPAALSGGMRKRVGLAQALVYEPDTLLLDEPFGALDALLRLKLHEELNRIVNRLKTTALLVTHDMDEAVTLADRVVVMSARPARIAAEVPVDIPRAERGAASQGSDRYLEIRRQVWEELSAVIDSTETTGADA